MINTIKRIKGTEAGSITTDWVVLAASAVLLTFTVAHTASGDNLLAMIKLQSTGPMVTLSAPN